MTGAEGIIDLIYAFRRSKTMFAAVSLGIFDRLRDGPKRAGEFDLREDLAVRLLDACVSLGLLEREGELYSNTAASQRYLTRGSPDTLTGYVLYSDQALYPMWGDFNGALREGTPRWEPVLGFPPGGIFDHFFRTENQKRDFLMGMHGFGILSSESVVSAFDLSGFERLVDLGGATGHLASAAVRRYPGLRAAVFDLPQVIDFARTVAGPEVKLISGDFFRDPLPPADLFTVGRILHDWNEQKIRTLLGRIHDALPDGGGLLVAEILLDDDKRGPVEAHMQSLNMLVCTEGRERSLPEYRQLLESCGFSDVQGRRTGTLLDAVLARKLQ